MDNMTPRFCSVVGSCIFMLQHVRGRSWHLLACKFDTTCAWHAVPELRTAAAARSFNSELARSDYELRQWRYVLLSA